MASQIANDIQGITKGIDIVRRRVTLPVVYALAQTDGRTREQLELAFRRPTQSTIDVAKLRDLLFQTGSVYYAMSKMEFYKQRALDGLSEAEKAGTSVEWLKVFLE
jgi:geranylgeranyl pyrophosphate synthase